MRSVLEWVEGEPVSIKSHFPHMEVHKSSTISHQVFVAWPCIVFERQPSQCTSLRFDDTHVGIVFEFVSVQHPPLLSSRYCICFVALALESQVWRTISRKSKKKCHIVRRSSATSSDIVILKTEQLCRERLICGKYCRPKEL